VNRLQRLHDAAEILRRLEDGGIDLDSIAAGLEREGVRSFESKIS
jgi:hypothetical protein